MGAISLTDSRLCALFAESILYGFYLISFITTAKILIFSHYKIKHVEDLNIPVLLGTMVLFSMTTGNLALSFYQSRRAFILSPFPNGPAEEYSDISSGISVVQTSFVLIGTLAGDWILIHRCWVFWNRSWRWLLITAISWLGCLFCAIRIIILESTFRGQPGVVYSPPILPYGIGFWAASIFVNVSTTVLTIYRLYLIDKANKESGLQPPVEVHEFPASTMRYMICIIVESGLLNTISTTGTLVTYAIQSNAVYILLGMKLPVIGITCDLIVVRGNRRTKQLLKLRLQKSLDRSGFNRVGVPDTIPISSMSISVGPMNTSTDIEGQTTKEETIPELPYP